ncbi:MAG: hypothetical protein GX352_08775 [Clostridiales bacterium]|nr:hypothetical protein [Clostridiales bacterium]
MTGYLSYACSILISLTLTLYLKSLLQNALLSMGVTMENYDGKKTITGMGLLFFIPCIVSIFPLLAILSSVDILIYITVLFALTLAGYIDDSLGDKGRKGFKGHISGIVKGNLSTGIIKAIIALIMGATISSIYFSGIINIILNTLLFCLCVNIMNLMDLRPGRAAKSFLFFCLIVAIPASLNSIWILLPITTSLLLYIKGELQEKYMMGDAGSNLLGGLFGLYTLRVASGETKLFLIFFLVTLHIASEFKSFSKIINSTPILRYLDSLGQKRERQP